MSRPGVNLEQQLLSCQQQLLASEARFRDIIERDADAILAVDREGTIRFVNRAAEALLGCGAQELVGGLFGHPLVVGEVAEIDLVRRDGAARVAEMRVVQSEWDGRPVYLATLRDVTERKQAEADLAWEMGINQAVVELSRTLIAASASIEDIAFLVLEHAKRLTGSPFGFVGHIDPHTGHLISSTMTRDVWDACQVPEKSVVFQQFAGLWGWVLDNRQPLLSNAPQDDPRSTGVPEGHLPVRRFLSAPALVGDTLLGQIALINADQDYGPRDLDAVERLASLYALAIQRRQNEESLREATRRITNILDSVHDGFLALDHDLVVTDFSRAAEKLLGRKREEVLGRPLSDSFPEAKGSIFEEKYTYAVRHKETVLFETYFGVAPYENWYDVQVFPFRDGISVFFQVITERKQAEQALRESEEKYRTLVEKSLQGVVIAKADPVRLSFANQAMEAITGFAPAELLHMGLQQLADLIHPQDRDTFFQNFQDRIAGQEIEPRREYRVVHRDGSVRWVLSYSSRIEFEGSPATLTVFVDITDRHRAEEALRQAEQRLGKMLQTMVDGMVMVDLEGQIVYANQGAGRILEIRRDEILGRYFQGREWRQVDEHGRPYPQADLPLATALREEEEVEGLEHGIIAPDGTTKWLSVNAAPLFDEQGQVSGAVASFRDITERKRAEEMLSRQAAELARSNEELQQFAYVASHDLQEPLRMVSSYVQLLARHYQGRLDDEADEFIAYAVEGANRLQTLVRDLLHYSRVGQAGRAFESIDCEFIVDLVLDNLQLAIGESGAVVSHDHLPTVLGDATELGQVFQNLIGNALKFRCGDPPRVRIWVKQQGKEWIFAVQDNGIGIEPEYQHKVFEAFQRLHSREKYPGSGIGLALCKKIVERHGGRIWVESALGQGSTFYFTLPVK